MPYEGTLGSLRTCDVYLPDPQIGQEHLDFSFQPHKGILIYPRHGMTCVADGRELDARSQSRLTPLHHGSILQVGNFRLRVRLFEGLEGGSAVLMPDEAEIPTIPNDAYDRTNELPVIPQPEYQQTQGDDPGAVPEPSAQPFYPAQAVNRPQSMHRVDPMSAPGPVAGSYPPWQQGGVIPRQPDSMPPETQEDPFAHSDRLRIVSTYEDTDEAGRQQGSRWRSSWRRNDHG